jgi:hypothetical protein
MMNTAELDWKCEWLDGTMLAEYCPRFGALSILYLGSYQLLTGQPRGNPWKTKQFALGGLGHGAGCRMETSVR